MNQKKRVQDPFGPLYALRLLAEHNAEDPRATTFALGRVNGRAGPEIHLEKIGGENRDSHLFPEGTSLENR